jgi:recombination DNA repair RAD52 pathway protein
MIAQVERFKLPESELRDIANSINNRLPSEHLKTKKVAGDTVLYVPHVNIIEILNEIFTPTRGSWSFEVLECRQEDYYEYKEGGETMVRVTYLSRVRIIIPALGIVREDVGVDTGYAKKRVAQNAIANASKGSISKGLGRAARTIGDGLGLFLWRKEGKRGREIKTAQTNKILVQQELAELKALVKEHPRLKQRVLELTKNYTINIVQTLQGVKKFLEK